VIGLDAEPDNIDPHVTPFAHSHQIMMNIFDTLVMQDPKDASFKPALAASWEIAADGLSVVFHLRTDVKFHDGTPFNADAVKYSLDRVVNPATKSGSAASLLGPYAGSDVIDPATIKVNLKTPYAPLLDSMSQAFLSIVSPTAAAKYGVDQFGHNPVGSGAYIFKEWIAKDHLTITKNPNYNWASTVFQHQGPAYVDEITFKFIFDSSARTGTLESGETNLIEVVPESDVKTLQNEGFPIVQAQVPGVPTLLMLNTAKAPTDDIAVRKAMILGTDQQTIVNAIFFGLANPAHGPQSKATWDYNPAVETLYKFDASAARKTLDDAGWTMNGDHREKAGTKLTVDYVTSPLDLWAELWQSQMHDIGINVQLKQSTQAGWIESATKGQTNVAFLSWIASDPSSLAPLFSSKNIGTGFAWTYYKDPHLDDMLDKGGTTIDHDARKKIYDEVQMLIMQQALVVPLQDKSSLTGLGKNVHDVRVDARGWYLWLYDAWISG